MSKIVIVPKVGKGTDEDPIRPDLSAISEIAELHKVLNDFRAIGKEIQNIIFYTVNVKQDLGNEFEVEITIPDKLPDVPDEVKKAWEAMKKALEE